MAIPIAPLPFNIDALEPVVSATALRTHYDEHYLGYVRKLNNLIQDTIYQDLTLIDIVLRSGNNSTWDREQKIFNNANQAWNHVFFWNCLTDIDYEEPSLWLKERINANFDSVQKFKEEFTEAANNLLGSGWIWVVLNKNKELEIVSTKDAGNPIPSGKVPIFVLDVWEHAYYLDYRSDRNAYTKLIWQMANWSFMEQEIKRAEKFQKNSSRYKEFFGRPKWSAVSPNFILRRKSSVRVGAMVGGIAGMIVFFFLSMMVNLNFIPLPGLVNSTSTLNSGFIYFLGMFAGVILGAACGALVGIGTPVSMNDPQGALGN